MGSGRLKCLYARMSLRGRPHYGLVTSWNKEKGYGFISPTDSKTGDLFVHVDGIKDHTVKELSRGDRVKFDIEQNVMRTRNAGKMFAVNVEQISGRGRSRSRSRSRRRRSPSGRRKKSSSSSRARAGRKVGRDKVKKKDKGKDKGKKKEKLQE